MCQALVTCIVPAFNGDRYLREALDSIVAQTYRPTEIIVVDDGSTDGTADLVAEYGKLVKYFWQPNTGPASARNLGWRVAAGKWVAFLDQDDVWHPEKLSRQIAYFDARPHLDVCVTHIQNFWVPELAAEAKRFAQHRLMQPIPGFLTQTMLARHELVDQVGPFDTSLQYGDGTDWFLRAIEHGVITELVQDVLVFRRLHHANFSRRFATASRNEYLHILKGSLDRRRRAELLSTAAFSS